MIWLLLIAAVLYVVLIVTGGRKGAEVIGLIGGIAFILYVAAFLLHLLK